MVKTFMCVIIEKKIYCIREKMLTNTKRMNVVGIELEINQQLKIYKKKKI